LIQVKCLWAEQISTHLVGSEETQKASQLCASRFYSVVVERDLFGQVVLVRNWGRIGTRGRELVEEHATENDALRAMQKLVEAKRRRGYEAL
jgi:predicted DNA-binding WGR domain protein